MVPDFVLSFKNFIENHQSVLIIAGKNKKIDNLACSYALALVLEKEGKNVSIYFTGQDLPGQLRFLNIQKFANKPLVSTPGSDGVIIVGGEEREHPDTLIPKHVSGNNVLKIQTEDSSNPVSEKITRALKEINENYITEVVATSLLTGIVASTQNFQNPHMQPQTLFASAYLIAKRARNELVVQHLYKIKSLETIKLWGSVIANFSYMDEKKIGWSFIRYNDLEEKNADKTLAALLINELKSNFGQAKIFILGIEPSENESIALIHALDPVLLEEFSQKTGATLKNSSCIMRLRPDYNIKDATSKAVKEIAATIS